MVIETECRIYLAGYLFFIFNIMQPLAFSKRDELRKIITMILNILNKRNHLVPAHNCLEPHVTESQFAWSVRP